MSEDTSKLWLQRLKDESWEAELLVAAVSIFGTLQLFGFIEWITNQFINLFPESFYIFAYFVVFSALLAISILACMFIIHFMLRAYWVGLIGLNSVFSDYSVDDEQDSKLYMKKLVAKLPKLDHTINQADRLCSVIFSAAFGFLMAYGWMFASAALYILLANALYEYLPIYVLLIQFILLFALIIIQTILLVVCNLKRFKQSDYWHTAYAKISIFVSIFTYGPLYKPILQISSIFSSNFKHDKALVKLVLVFVLCGFGVAGVKLFSTNIPYFIATDAYNSSASIDARHDRVVEVFIPVFAVERKMYESSCDSFTSLEEPSREERRLALGVCLQQYHEVLFNGEPVKYHLLKSEHAITKQYGAIAYVQVPDDVVDGLYKIEVKKTIYEEPKSWAIPFYYLLK